MNRLLVVSSIMFLTFASLAQADSLQKEINEQVWKPFIASFNNDDRATFRSLHSKDVIRVIQDDNTVLGYDEYFRDTPDSIKQKWGEWSRQIELRFIQRIAGNGKAFETGYYKTTSSNKRTGESRTGYGKFQVLLRKENGRWKILMDADAHEKTDETIFLTGAPIE